MHYKNGIYLVMAIFYFLCIWFKKTFHFKILGTRPSTKSGGFISFCPTFFCGDKKFPGHGKMKLFKDNKGVVTFESREEEKEKQILLQNPRESRASLWTHSIVTTRKITTKFISCLNSFPKKTPNYWQLLDCFTPFVRRSTLLVLRDIWSTYYKSVGC